MSEPYQLSIHRRAKPGLLASSARLPHPPRPTPDHPLIISASELMSFLRCRVQHHWRYQVGLVHPSKNKPQSIGTLGHIILDQWYQVPHAKRTTKAMKRIAKRAIAASLDQPKHEMNLEDGDRKLIEAMCVGYAEWTQRANNEYSDTNIGLVNCAPEEFFDLPLTPNGNIRVRGRLDNQFMPTVHKKTVALLESKFKGQIRYDAVENRLQLTVYLWALREKFPKMKRFQAYPQILRKQMPGPRVKADLFWRDMVERSVEEIDQWKIDTANVATDMLDGAVYPNPMDSCSYMCDFAVPCQLRGDKADLKHVLKETFIIKDRGAKQ